jgi:hypothetical protein
MSLPVDCLVLASIGIPFTLLGALKLYGLWRGVEGGPDKPLGQQLCGT